jgi:hypothetical protein
LVFHIVDFLIASVSEKLVVEHHVLPSDGLVEFELNFIHLVSRLHVDEEIGVVEDGIDQEVGRVLNVVNSACGWLDEHVLGHSSLALLQKNPAMHSFSQIEVGGELVRLIIVDSECLCCQLFLEFFVVFDDSAVEGGVRDAFGEYSLVQFD